MKIHIFKIKEGKLQTLKDWCDYLVAHKKDAIETLQEEGIDFEFLHFFNDAGTTYVLGGISGEAKPSNQEKEINVKHRAVLKECLEHVGFSEEGYFFNVDE